MAKLLSDRTVEQTALALNGKLYTYDRSGRSPDRDIRQAAAEIAETRYLIIAEW